MNARPELAALLSALGHPSARFVEVAREARDWETALTTAEVTDLCALADRLARAGSLSLGVLAEVCRGCLAVVPQRDEAAHLAPAAARGDIASVAWGVTHDRINRPREDARRPLLDHLHATLVPRVVEALLAYAAREAA